MYARKIGTLKTGRLIEGGRVIQGRYIQVRLLTDNVTQEKQSLHLFYIVNKGSLRACGRRMILALGSLYHHTSTKYFLHHFSVRLMEILSEIVVEINFRIVITEACFRWTAETVETKTISTDFYKTKN